MARQHHLDAGDLLRRDGRRPGRQRALVGAALVALASFSFAQEASTPEEVEEAQERDPLEARHLDLDDIVDQEWEALRSAAQEAGPDEREQAVAALHAWYEARAGQLKRAVQLIGYPAHALASSEEWTPDVDQRVQYWKDLVDALELMEAPELALENGSLATGILFRRGRFEEAAEYTEELLERFAHAETNRDYHLVRLAEARRELGEFGAALQALDDYEHLEPPSTEEALRVRSFLIRGMTYADLGVPDKAVPHIDQGLRLAEERHRKGGQPNEVMTARMASLLVAKAEANHEYVVDTVEELLEKPLYERHPVERRKLLTLQATSLLKIEPRTDANRVRGMELLYEVTAAGLPAEFEGHARLGLVNALLVDGSIQEAQAELQRIRTVLERDVGARALAQVRTDAAMYDVRLALEQGAPHDELVELEEPLDQAVEDLIGVWSQVPERTGGVGFLLYSQRRDAVAERIRLTRRLDPSNGEARALDYLMRIQAMGTLARREEVPVPSLGEIRSHLLGEGHGLLVYLPTRDLTYVFAIDSDTAMLATVGRGGDLDLARQEYLKHLLRTTGMQRSDDGVVALERKLAGDLASLLFSKELVALIQSWDHLTISGSDVLGPLPFEWLPLADERFLGVGRTVSYLPSVPLGVARAQVSADDVSDWDLLLMAATDPAQHVSERWPEAVALPFTETDRSALMGRYDQRRSMALVGERATLTALSRFDLRRASVLQFLGHAVRDFSRERPVGLVTAQDERSDGLVWCEQVEELAAPDLVLLTACRSGLGKQRRGDPAMTDMGGAWIAQGARAVVVASTDLYYGQAVRASDVIHERLTAGDSPAEALRGVRERLCEEYGEMAPMAGGLLHVVGLGHEPVFRGGLRKDGEDARSRLPRPWNTVVIGACLLAAFAAGALVSRARQKPTA